MVDNKMMWRDDVEIGVGMDGGGKDREMRERRRDAWSAIDFCLRDWDPLW